MPERKASGRVTPRGTRAGERGPAGASGRYTPPVHRVEARSPAWVAVAMFACFAVGALTVVLNYVDVLPGGTDTKYLLVGLGFVTVGFVLATRLR